MKPTFPEYRPRTTTFLGLRDRAGWVVKMYGISVGNGPPPADAVTAAEALLPGVLPSPAVTSGRYGVGFAIVHEGEDALWVLVDWWEDTCLLHHRLYTAPLDDPDSLCEVDDPTLTACTWELSVIAHERTAWVEAVQKAGAEADLADYLARTF